MAQGEWRRTMKIFEQLQRAIDANAWATVVIKDGVCFIYAKGCPEPIVVTEQRPVSLEFGMVNDSIIQWSANFFEHRPAQDA
jgi:hypothetical protein